MDIKSLETFLYIVKYNSFTKAAEKLYCSQAAASQRIKRIENHFAIKFFSRTNNKFTLTQEGKQFLPYAEQIVRLFREAEEHLFLSGEFAESHICFSSSTTPGTYIFPKIIFAFKEKYHHVSIVNQIQYTHNVIEDILDNRFPFGFISQPFPIKINEILCEPFMSDPISIFISKNAPLASQDRISIDDLLSLPFLVTNNNTSIIKYLEETYGFQFSADHIHVMGNIEATKRGLIENMGFSVLSRYSVSSEIQYGLIQEVKLEDITDLKRDIYMIQRKDRELSRPEQIFVHFIREYLKNLQRECS